MLQVVFSPHLPPATERFRPGTWWAMIGSLTGSPKPCESEHQSHSRNLSELYVRKKKGSKTNFNLFFILNYRIHNIK